MNVFLYLWRMSCLKIRSSDSKRGPQISCRTANQHTKFCKFVDSYVQTCSAKSAPHITLDILRNIPFASLYASSNFDSHDEGNTPQSSTIQTFIKGHKYIFVKKIIELYINMKSVHIAKSFTMSSHDTLVRHDYKKLIQQLGQ